MLKQDNAPKVFSFSGDKTIRVVMLEKEPWFVAKDVAVALGLVSNGTGSYHASLSKSEKMVLKGEVDKIYYPFLFPGSTAKSTLVSESGLYKLILRAHPSNPAAKKFQDWVTREVLPAIRKDGMYVMGEEKVRTGELSEEEFILKAMTMLKGKVDFCRQNLRPVRHVLVRACFPRAGVLFSLWPWRIQEQGGLKPPSISTLQASICHTNCHTRPATVGNATQPPDY